MTTWQKLKLKLNGYLIRFLYKVDDYLPLFNALRKDQGILHIKAFLSYSDKDKHLAGRYKRHLEKYYGFQVYVAHDDNTPSLDWGPEIKDSIELTDIFITLVSKNSKNSCFVNQEIGIAICLGVPVFPIKIDKTNPFGFIYKIHGFPYIEDEDSAVLKNGSKLFSLLTSNKREFLDFGKIAIESAIYALLKSPHFKDTNIIIETLLETENQRGFNNRHLYRLKKACLNNYEIYGGAFAYPRLKKLLKNKYNVKGLK